MVRGRRSWSGCGPDAIWTRVRNGRSGSTRLWSAGISTLRVPAMRRPRTSRPRGWHRCCATRNRPPNPRRSRRLRRTPRTAQGAESNDTNPAPARATRADREGLGCSRGGLSTKIHLLADSRCRPLARVTTAGQRHDSLAFQPLMGRLRIRRLGRGRPRTRPTASRQGVLEPHDSRLPAATPDQGDDPGEDRPAADPRCQGLPRWTATGV
jgi:hypothetical protein